MIMKTTTTKKILSLAKITHQYNVVLHCGIHLNITSIINTLLPVWTEMMRGLLKETFTPVVPAPSEVHLATFFSGCVMEKVRPGQHLLSQSGEQFVHIVTDSELHVLRCDEDTPDWCGTLRSLL